MSDLIRRDEAIKQIHETLDNQEWTMVANVVEKILIGIPTTEERKEGEWIHDVHYGLKLPEHRCSICGEWEYSDTESNFCPNCGAKMKGE